MRLARLERRVGQRNAQGPYGDKAWPGSEWYEAFARAWEELESLDRLAWARAVDEVPEEDTG